MKKLISNHIFIITVVYAIVITILQITNGWYQNFSDAVHYLWIADKYELHDWTNAINTYWGPMISWLLFFLKPIISAPFVRFRVLQVILGFTALLLINNVLKKKEIDKKLRIWFTLVSIPLIASFAWFYLTPDLLLVNGILIAIRFFLSKQEMHFTRILLAALIGALLFYIKSVGLFFFVLLVLGKFLSEKKQWNFLSFVHCCSIALFLFIFCGPWIYLISKKHGSFTVGTSSGHNYKMNSPRITPDIYGEVGNPYHLGTLTEPNPPKAFDACVEHAHQKYLSWEGMTKQEIRDYYKKILVKNLKSARSMFFGLDIGSIFLLLFFLACILYRKEMRHFIVENNVFFLIVAGNIFLYLPFFFMDRYTWPGLLSFFFLTVILISRFPLFKKTAVIVLTLVTFLALNLYTIRKEYQYSLSEKVITESIWESRQRVELKRTIWLCDRNDKRLGLVKGMIYYNKGQYLGALFYGELTPQQIKEQLTSFNIHSIVSLDPKIDMFLLNSGFAKESFNSLGLQTYQCRPKPEPTPRGTVVMLNR